MASGGAGMVDDDADLTRARALLRAGFAAGVARAEPGDAVSAALRDVAPPARIMALGKAAIPMARAALGRFPGTPCLVVTNRENAVALPGAQVVVGGHPVPDAGSLRAGEALLAEARRLRPGEEGLVLVSGGGSALAAAPRAGVSLADKARVSELLLASGLDIRAMNLVRQGLSRLKGGGLARAAFPGRLRALLLSDVVGDDPAAIASGPTVRPLGTPSEAAELLREKAVWDLVPESCRVALSRGSEPVPEGEVRVVGSNAASVAAMGAAMPGAHIVDRPLTGDVGAAAAVVATAARAGRGVTVWGGETTVVLRGAGLGGRNQELAMRVALLLRDIDRPWAFLSGGTDGRDGPTEAAGGLVDDGSLARIAAAGLDVEALLARNDSHRALAASGDLLVTGGTGTNVADLQGLWVG